MKGKKKLIRIMTEWWIRQTFLILFHSSLVAQNIMMQTNILPIEDDDGGFQIYTGSATVKNTINEPISGVSVQFYVAVFSRYYNGQLCAETYCYSNSKTVNGVTDINGQVNFSISFPNPAPGYSELETNIIKISYNDVKFAPIGAPYSYTQNSTAHSFSADFTVPFNLTNEERRKFLHYYSPVIVKRAWESDEHTRGEDWISNWYYDGDNILKNNGDNWDNYLASFVNGNPSPTGSVWSIRPTIYTSLVEFVEYGKKSLVLTYHIYNPRDLDGKVHDWERVELRVDNVNNRVPGNGESINYVCITNHKKQFALQGSHDNLSYYSPSISSGKHVIIFQAQNDVSFSNTSLVPDEENGGGLSFVKNGNQLFSSVLSQTEFANVTIHNSYENIDHSNVAYHYVFVDYEAPAAQIMAAQTISAVNAHSIGVGLNPSQYLLNSERRFIKYELQDIADIVPTMLSDQDWKEELLFEGTNEVRAEVYFSTPLIDENGNTVVQTGLNKFYPQARNDVNGDKGREGYIRKGWLWGTYDLGCSDDGDNRDIELFYVLDGPTSRRVYQHLFIVHDGIRDCDGNSHQYVLHDYYRHVVNRDVNVYGNWWDLDKVDANGNKINTVFEMDDNMTRVFNAFQGSYDANWYKPEYGGFDGRWVQLFDDSQDEFMAVSNVTTDYGMDAQKWRLDRRKVHIGDFNGDGRQDILLQGCDETRNTYLLIANANNGFDYYDVTNNTTMGMDGSKWASNGRVLHVGDFNGDGKKDVLLQSISDTRNAYVLYGQQTLPYLGASMDISNSYGMNKVSWSNDNRKLYIGDFNADGREDLILQGRSSDKNTYLLMGQSLVGFSSVVTINTAYGMDQQKWRADYRNLFLADFNGDGRKDIILQGNLSDRATYLLMGKTNGTTGNYFEGVTELSANVYGMDKLKWSASHRNLFIGHFNGDLRDDILLQATQDDNLTYLLMAKASGTTGNYFEMMSNITDSYGMSITNWSDDRRKINILDIDGNGRQDILLRSQTDDNTTFLLLANTVTLFDPKLDISYTYSMEKYKWSDDRRLSHILDFNGDSRDDILLQGRLEDKETYLVTAQDHFVVSIKGSSLVPSNVGSSWSPEIASGSGSYSYKWYKNGQFVDTTASVTLFPTSNFILKLEVTDNRYRTKVSASINVAVTGVSNIAKTPQIPSEYMLHTNYPNPFNPTTTIRYDLKEKTKISLKIYNMMGQEVRTLVNGILDAGFYSYLWDGKNNSGEHVASGIYVYRLVSPKFTSTKKMMLIK